MECLGRLKCSDITLSLCSSVRLASIFFHNVEPRRANDGLYYIGGRAREGISNLVCVLVGACDGTTDVGMGTK